MTQRFHLQLTDNHPLDLLCYFRQEHAMELAVMANIYMLTILRVAQWLSG